MSLGSGRDLYAAMKKTAEGWRARPGCDGGVADSVIHAAIEIASVQARSRPSSAESPQGDLAMYQPQFQLPLKVGARELRALAELPIP